MFQDFSGSYGINIFQENNPVYTLTKTLGEFKDYFIKVVSTLFQDFLVCACMPVCVHREYCFFKFFSFFL